MTPQLSNVFFFFQAEDGIRDVAVTGVQTCALPICLAARVVPWQIPPNGVVVNGVLEATQPIVALAADANRVAMTYAQGRCIETRSEERRVGKEGRSRWSPYH